ncbi:MAG: hypothetical protein Q9202_006109 [Teloschistes flavicans]
MAVINYLLRTYDTTYTLHPAPSAPPQDLVDYDKWTLLPHHHPRPHDGPAQLVHAFPRPRERRRPAAIHGAGDAVLQGAGRAAGEERRQERLARWVLGGGLPLLLLVSAVWDFAGVDLAGLEYVRRWLEGVGGMEVVKKVYAEVPKARRGVDCL